MTKSRIVSAVAIEFAGRYSSLLGCDSYAHAKDNYHPCPLPRRGWNGRIGTGSAFADEPHLTTSAVYNTFDECSATGDDLVAQHKVDVWSCDPTGEGDKTALNVHYTW
jgi:hypothetical protein